MKPQTQPRADSSSNNTLVTRMLISPITALSMMRGHVFAQLLSILVIGCVSRTEIPPEKIYQKRGNRNPNECCSNPEINFLFDWESTIEPCKYNLSWLSTVEREKTRIMRTDAKQTAMIAKEINVEGLVSSIVIQTYTTAGQKKTFGGDSWRGTLTGPSHQMSFVHDNMDGTYKVQFRIYKNGRYKLLMVLEQSMCDGLRDPPLGWFEHGDLQGHYQSLTLLGDSKDNILEKVIFGPFEVKDMKKPKVSKGKEYSERKLRRTAQSCRERGWMFNEAQSKNTYLKADQTEKTNRCLLVWESFGRWLKVKGEYIYLPNNTSDISSIAMGDKKFDSLWIYGDSVSYIWWQSSFRRDLCKKLFKFCFHTYTYTYAEGKFKKSHINYGRPFNKSRFLDPIRVVFKNPHMKTKRSILVINFGIHLILSLNFTELRDTVDKFAELVKQKRLAEGTTFPRIIWRTTTSTAPEVKDLITTLSGRFLTNHRIRLFNAYANSKLCPIGIDILDVFAVTSSYPKLCKDGLHFSQETFNYPHKAFKIFLKECM